MFYRVSALTLPASLSVEYLQLSVTSQPEYVHANSLE